MTDQAQKRRKLSTEILIIVGICFAVSILLYFIITHLGIAIVSEYCFYHDIELGEDEWYRLDTTMLSAGFAVSAVVFVLMFIALFGERLAYIRKITDGIHALRRGERDARVALVGNNELTELAEAVNYLSESEQRIKQKERALNEEKETLIRTLSHDIRTPLTSIMSYTELLAAKEDLTREEQKQYLELVGQKSAQIKQLTDILLDGGRREVEQFDDARLLFEQLADGFEGELEEEFDVALDLSALTAFSGRFDVREMQRIFDNLISNVGKYAEPTKPVTLSVSNAQRAVVIRQSNAIKQAPAAGESYRMGLHSIRRIAQGYGGSVEVTDLDASFEIVITLSNIG